MFLDQSSHHLLLEPASTLVALIDSDSFTFTLLCTCFLSLQKLLFQFSRSLKRCKSNDDFWVLFTALEDLPLKIVFHQSHFSCSNVQWQNIHWVHKCRRPFAPGKHLVHLRLCKRQSCSILMLKYLCTGRGSGAYWPVRGPTHAASLPPPLDCHREKIPGVWLFELLGFGIFE